jgi:hypothetical protein
VTFSSAASVSSGSFAGALSSPGSGAYDVWAKACFGDNCATQFAPITI